MKRYLLILLGALAFAVPQVPQRTEAASVFIEIGDRPYYVHGPWYVSRGYRWCWVPGHWRYRYHHRWWVHGHYVRCW